MNFARDRNLSNYEFPNAGNFFVGPTRDWIRLGAGSSCAIILGINEQNLLHEAVNNTCTLIYDLIELTVSKMFVSLFFIAKHMRGQQTN